MCAGFAFSVRWERFMPDAASRRLHRLPAFPTQRTSRARSGRRLARLQANSYAGAFCAETCIERPCDERASSLFRLGHAKMNVSWEPLWRVLLSRTIIVGAVVMLSQPARVAGAEEQPDNEWEAGLQTTIIRLAVPSERSLGFGGRIGRTLSTHIAVEAEANHFPENPGGNFAETQVVGGVKAGARVGSWSGFIKIRPGWLRFGGRDFRARNSASNYAVLDLGAVAERSITDRIAFRM